MSWRRYVAPVYLAACLLLGGSSQGIWSNLSLQLIAVGLLVGAFTLRDGQPSGRNAARALYWILAAGITWTLIQLFPLPPQIWTQIPGRQLVIEGFELVGMPLPWLPISLTPNATIASILAGLPALAIFIWLMKQPAPPERWMAGVILAVTGLAVILGILQRTDQSFQLYPITNTGATGFFANSNHMGALLLVAIPFLAAMVASFRSEARKKDANASIWKITALLGASVLMVGVVVNGSSAVLLLAAPVALASLLLFIPLQRVRVGRMWATLGLLIVASIGIAGWLAAKGLRTTDQSSFSIREEIWSQTIDLIAVHGWFGTGLGSFPRLYPTMEDSDAVDWVYVNLAHNDFLQLALELGLPGLIIIVAFLVWCALSSAQVWKSSQNVHFAKAATIASAALLLHSLVDYPLRTSALSAVFAAAVALIILRPHSSADDKSARHLRLEDL